MKKNTRTLRQALVALAAIAFIGFGFAACDSPTGSGGNGDNGYFMVTFNTHGGTPVPPQRAERGWETTRPPQDPTRPPQDPTRPGYTFVNWFTHETGWTVFNFYTTPIIGPTTIHARWQPQGAVPDYYTITFDTRGGYPVPPPQQADNRGWLLATEPAAPTRSGYDFAGWEDAQGDLIPNSWWVGANWPTLTGSITLYARWIVLHPVTFITYDGSEFAAQQVRDGERPTVPLPAPVRYSYRFTRWYTEAPGGTLFDFTAATVTEPLRLYAGWVSAPTITFDTHGGSNIPQQSVLVGESVPRPPNPLRVGYSFDGWYTAAAGGMRFSFAEPVSAALTAHARWTRRQGVAQVSVGNNHTVAIRADGSLWAWGGNGGGQLGLGDTTSRNAPQRVGQDNDWAMVSAGNSYTMAIRADGTLWAWGWREWGRLGQGAATATAQTTPIQVGTASDWVAVSAGGQHTMGIRADGSLWGWGYDSGRLGTGLASPPQWRPAPVRIGGHSWVAVSAGSGSGIFQQYTMGIRADGSLWGWGVRDGGRLGDGFTGGVGLNNQATPVQIEEENDWATVSAGFGHTMGIRDDGNGNRTLWAWGSNANGRLGVGGMVEGTPIRIGGTSGYTDWLTVSAGGQHTMGIRGVTSGTGSLWAWGNRADGRLGIGGDTSGNQTTPSRVGGTTGYTDWFMVSAGWEHTMGIRADGSLWAWGNRANGRLGVGDPTTGNEPEPVPVNPSDWQ